MSTGINVVLVCTMEEGLWLFQSPRVYMAREFVRVCLYGLKVRYTMKMLRDGMKDWWSWLFILYVAYVNIK